MTYTVSDYANAAESAARECLVWLMEHPEADRPDDVWKVSKDCPLWKAGLSSFQAGWAWRWALNHETKP